MFRLILLATMATAPASAPITGSLQAAHSPDKRFCRTYGTTGSYLKVKRVCLTKLEWKAFDKGLGQITQGRKDGLITPHACMPGFSTGGCGESGAE